MALTVGSAMDVNAIVEQLMVAEQKPLKLLATKEASHKSRLSAYSSLSSALSTFQGKLADLTNLSRFQKNTISTSEAGIATVTAGSTAKAGQYNIDVTQLAQAQSLSSAGQASANGSIGSGATTTITFQFGTIAGGTLTGGSYSGASFTSAAGKNSGSITIDGSNNSLQGIRDAINKADLGVTASIVSDGSDTPHRLVLTSTETGANSSLKITVDGDAALSSLLSQDPVGTQQLRENAAGKDALATIDGIEIKNPSNTLDKNIEGLNITLAKIGKTTVSLTRDTSSITSAVNAFVTAYNELHGTLKYQTSYNAETKTGGPLVGDATARTIQLGIQRMFSTQPEGLTGELKNLSQIGISFQKDGTLALDNAKLQTAVTKFPDDIGRLFATAAAPTDSLVKYASSTAATQAGKYEVLVTQLASQGKATGSVPATTTIQHNVNDQLNFTIDGISAFVTIPAGNYTAATLAAQLQSSINGISAFSKENVSVTVTENNGVLSVTSNRYGSASHVKIDGAGAADLFGNAPLLTDGVDVAGTFNGIAGIGSGQSLNGLIGSAAEGLKIDIMGGALGERGSIDFSRGYATNLQGLLGNYLGSSGMIAGRTDGINENIKQLNNQRTAINTRLIDIEARYRKQYSSLDVLLSNMGATSNYLTQQLAALSNLNG
ncbi:putative flagellar hook-associated protein 2 FliD [Herminiimonas arsenicoxydans]|uniref:Flagellar hook-associated protein 2 n=1 Tax=Herminiimonas arsenicoxydans TaxID=204773 RepID=A4G682_HERAR|nr:putative flagellar hook-associated protein 2 FliD [Herminiimonas arsenicoxydans]